MWISDRSSGLSGSGFGSKFSLRIQTTQNRQCPDVGVVHIYIYIYTYGLTGYLTVSSELLLKASSNAAPRLPAKCL